MPRTKKPASAPTATATSGRRRKAAAAESQAPAPAPEFTADEQKYVEKYPDRRFVAGSLSAPGAETCFGRKRVITILCASCDTPRVIATSDIFHCRLCPGCTAAARKEARKAKRKEGAAGAPAA